MLENKKYFTCDSTGSFCENMTKNVCEIFELLCIMDIYIINSGGDEVIRRGRFALWEGKEYGLISNQRQYYLQSVNLLDLENGFVRKNGDQSVFIKPVSIRELEDAYEIFPYAMIAGYRFALEGYNEKTGKVVLVTNNPFVKEKIEVQAYGKFEYIIEISLDDIRLEEDRIPILGFEGFRT